MDGAGAADLQLNAVRLPPAALMTFDVSPQTVLHDALEWGLLGVSAEAAGIIGALNRATFAYLNSRKQFGASLATFQALQHRAADMFIAAEEVSAAVNHAVAALDEPPGIARSAAICAAKVTADIAGRRVGHEAVQMHGGMGVSDELNVSHYARRLATIRAELGSADTHRQRLASLQ
jgi:alkylation response protein AidB-like acyl-CoA dehydrogenase